MNRVTSVSDRLAGVAAALVGVVCVIHLQDQQWLAFHKAPGYVQIGYVMLELACVVVAAALLVRPAPVLWVLALGCGVGPFVGYVLSRGPGLPLYPGRHRQLGRAARRRLTRRRGPADRARSWRTQRSALADLAEVGFDDRVS